jgi:hypothetical protein
VLLMRKLVAASMRQQAVAHVSKAKMCCRCEETPPHA